MAERQGFTIYHSDLKSLSRFLNAEQIGKLMLAVGEYSETGELPAEIDPCIAGAMALLIPKIDDQRGKYEKTCERNRANRTSGVQSSPVVTSGDQWSKDESSRDQQKQELKQELELKQEQEHNRILTDADGGEAANAHACARETHEVPDTDDGSVATATGTENVQVDVAVAKNATTTQKPSKKPRKQTDAALIAEAIKDYADGDAELEGLLQDWMANRKAKRQPQTIRAIQLNLDKLDAMAQESGMPVKAYLRDVIARGWAAFFAIKDGGGGGYRASPRLQQQSTADYYLQLMQEME